MRFLTLVLVAACIGRGGREDTVETPAPDEPIEVDYREDPETRGLAIRLFEADPAAPIAADGPRSVEGTPLSDAQVERLLQRVPDLELEHGDRSTFAIRKGSPPPPLSGSDVQIPFPPETAPDAPTVTADALQVLRFAPEGEVPIAPHVSVTFDQPMIAVTSHAEAAKQIPVKITPEPPGRWRWLGTRTVLFDPEPRLPMATEYRVEIPAGTESATGTKLSEAVAFTFGTPAPQLTQLWPNSWEPQPLQPVIVVGFDQRVDAATIAEASRLTAAGKPVDVRLATAEELTEDAAASSVVAQQEADRWVALRPVEALPRAAHVQLAVPAGTVGAEGPRPTPHDQHASFSTYAPLAIQAHHCMWNEPCPPTSGWMIEMNNPLDPAAFDGASVTVDPAVPGWFVQAIGNTLQMSGAFRGRTAYTVTLPADLTDAFGQQLGEATERVFKVGPADPTLTSPGDTLVVLDPDGGAKLPVFSTNHRTLKVQVHAVGPEHWDDWVDWLEKLWYEDNRPGRLPGQRVHQGTLTPPTDPDAQVESALDLSEHVDENGHGQFVVLIEPQKQPRNRWERQYVARWVQATDLGLTAFSDGFSVVGWATDLGTGAPVEGVEMTVDDQQQTTGGDGLARMEPPDTASSRQILVARSDTDLAILPAAQGMWGGGAWVKASDLDHLRWYVTDDRGLYKPGERVRLFGWLRRWEVGPTGDVGPLDGGANKVTWQLTGTRGNEIAKGEAEITPLGGFEIAVDLPGDANLGTAYLYLSADGGDAVNGTSTNHPIQIQEFRRPEFEVTATADDGPHVLGQDARVDLTAAYYAGGGLPGADVTWTAYASPGSYVPPGANGYAFGAWSPWWMPWHSGQLGFQLPAQTLQVKTDGSGEHHLGLHFESMEPPLPANVQVQGTVMDVNRQAWTASASVLVHPASVYVGVKTERAFVEKGDDIDVELAVVDIDGKPVADAPVELRFARMEGKWSRTGWSEEEHDPEDCAPTANAKGLATCTFKPVRGGSYRLQAQVRDEHGRRNRTELRVWVSGAEQTPARNVALEQVTLVPEQQEVRPGETARVLVQAPFTPAEGVWSLRRSGIAEATRFRMEEPTIVLEIPVEEGHVPDLTLQVDLLGQAPRLDDDGDPVEGTSRVAHASGSITFQVPPIGRTLSVTAEPAAEILAPGAETAIALTVQDADGEPVEGAEIAIVVVDEAVLALTGFELPDPIDLFYSARGPGTWDRRLRTHVALADPQTVDATTVPTPDAAMPMGGALGYLGAGDGGGGANRTRNEPMTVSESVAQPAAPPMEMKKSEKSKDTMYRVSAVATGKSAGADAAGPAIAMREDFSATALFAPDVTTDAKGHAEVPFTVPDSLTRYRVMVVAVDDGNAFGSTDAAITARLPLMVRPSLPRFLNFGDQAELPIVLQNQTDAPLIVDLALRTTNLRFVDALTETLPDLPDISESTTGRRLEVPPNDRIEVRLPAATVMAGTARVQVVASAGDHTDAQVLSLPVWTPATTEAFATYGEIDDGGIVQPVAAPPDVWTQFGGLEVTTSSTQLQALTDAVIYLESYPFECNEQLASRLLAIASLRDVLAAFEADGLPAPEALEARVDDDIARLTRRQNWDGGFAFWRRGDPSWPYLSIHVANAFARAKAKGYDVPEDAWQRSYAHMRDIESYIPHWYSQRSKWFLRAYSVDVQRRMGQPNLRQAKRLFTEAGTKGLGIDGQAFLLPTLSEGGAKTQVDQIVRHLGNNVAESAAGAHFVTGYDDGAHVLLHSDRRADGIVLESLIETRPDSDLIPKVVRGLLAHRVKGHWGNTQENAFVLLSLDRYFRVFEKETPDFVARMWLGEGYVGDHTFKGRTTERAHANVPMGYLTESPDPQPLTLVKDGDDGRLYYRIGLKYAPKDLRLEPADQGFAVDRRYEAVDDPDDVRRDEDGTWRIKAGARVRVELTMASDMRRYHVALVDPLPAGLEASNPALATTGTLPQDPSSLEGNRFWWWSRTWYEHENLRDERVEAFSSLLWDGVHSYSYIARATTPGRYVVPPTKAEEMYHPETFGRSATDRVVVE